MDKLKLQKTAASTNSINAGTSSTPKPSGSGAILPITVCFNAGEESIDDLFQSYHNIMSNNQALSGCVGSRVSVCGNCGVSSVGVGGVGGVGGGADGGNPASPLANVNNIRGSSDTVSISPSQHPQNTISNPDEMNSRNNLLQGNFFNRKSGKQQLPPNHLCSATLDAGIGAQGGGPRSSNSPMSGAPILGGGGSPYGNGSSGGLLPNSSAGISPNKYRRSISFPLIGATASTAGHTLDMKGGHALPTLNISNGANTAGASGGGDAPNLGAGGGGGSGGGRGIGVNPYMGNGLDMRPLDQCLNDIMRNMGAVGGAGALLAERIRHQKHSEHHHMSEVCAVAIAASAGSEHTPRYSRKVFVGGLPPDIDEDEITNSFRRFGALVVDWPHKAESKSFFPPKGYAFLLFQDESSVQRLIDSCITDEEKLYLCVSSPTIRDKPVQIRPWRLADADYVLDTTMSLDARKTVFVGGVPRPLKAHELAMIMDRLYGGVCYAGIDTDPELKYPKGAGRVTFSNPQSYIAAISARFVQLQHSDIDKRVEVKPYVLDDQMCDECDGKRCGGKFAPFFCGNVTCLQYYCEHCWTVIHSRAGREYHKPLVKEGSDRPRAMAFRWC